MTYADARPEDALTTIALVASGSDAAVWAHAIRGHGGVAVDVIGATSHEDLLDRLSAADIDGVVFAQGFPDLAAAIKRALIVRKHVLCAPAIADSHQLLVLEELARARQRALLFDAGELSDPRIETVRRSTRSEHGLRRIRYVRSTTVDADADGVDDAAVRALARIAPLLGLPKSLTASGTAAQPEGPLGWATVTARFDDGATARIDVSTMEPEPRDEVVVVSAARSFVLEAGQLQLVSTARTSRLGGGVREERSRPVVRTREERLSETFLEAVRAQEFQSNARDLARGALMWEMARASLRRDGEQVTLPGIHPLVANARPSLQVIKGGGHTTYASEAPRLRVMAGGRLAEREEPYSPPPQSA